MRKSILAYVLAICLLMQNLGTVSYAAESEDFTDFAVEEASKEAVSENEVICEDEDVSDDDISGGEVYTVSENEPVVEVPTVSDGANNTVEPKTEVLEVTSDNTTTYTVAELAVTIEERLQFALETYQTDFYLADLRIADTEAENLSALYKQFMLEHPEYFWLEETAGTLVENGIVTYMEFGYKGNYWHNNGFDISKIREDREFLEKIIYEILAPMDDTMTDVEKAYYLYQYLVRNVEYDYTYSKFTAYDALVGGSAVCQGYMLAYTLLLNYIEIPVKNVVSFCMEHGWNMIQVDGSWFYVDATWGRGYNVFLYTEEQLRTLHMNVTGCEQRKDWKFYEGREITDIEGNTDIPETGDNSIYSDYLFRSTYQQVYTNGAWYYISDGSLCKSNLSGLEKTTIGNADRVCLESFMDKVYYIDIDATVAKLYCYDTNAQSNTLLKSYEDINFVNSFTVKEGALKISLFSNNSEIGVVEDSIELGKEIAGMMILPPVENTYQVGDEWNPVGMSVYLIYSDRTIEKQSEKDYTVSGFSTETVGETVATVSCNGFQQELTYWVAAAQTNPGVHVKRQAYIFAGIGEIATIQAELRGGINGTVSYVSSNTDVVSVSENGELIAKKEGAAYITVTCDSYANTVYVAVDIIEESSAGDNLNLIYKYDDTTLTATVVSISGDGTTLEVPSTVILAGTEYTVTAIEAEDYLGYAQIETLILPSTVTRIGDAAFSGVGELAKLKNVTIPENCVIGMGAFASTSIENLTLPRGTVLGEYAFRGCEKLKSVELQVTEVSDSCFADCSSLDTISWGSNVTSIARRAFSGCNFTSVSIPNGVTEIGDYAFAENSSLTELTIPATVVTIGAGMCSSAALDIEIHLYCTSIATVGGPVAMGATNAKFIFHGDFTQEQIELFGDINYEIVGDDPYPDGPPEDDALFEENKIYLKLGEKHKILSRYYEMSELTFENYAPHVATMDENGVITALSMGSAQFSVFDTEGTFLDYISVVVYDFAFEATHVQMQLGDTLTLPVQSKNIYVGNFEKMLEYTIDGAQVAEIIEKGETMPVISGQGSSFGSYGYITIRAKNIGTSTITIKDPNLGVDTSCVVTVTEKEREFDDGVFYYREVGDGELEITGTIETVDENGAKFWFQYNSKYYVSDLGEGVLTVPSEVSFGENTYKVIGIADNAFCNDTMEIHVPIAQIIVEEGIEYIGNQAFKGFPIVGIKLPSSLKTIGVGAFINCGIWEYVDGETTKSGVAPIVIPENVTQIGENCFANSAIGSVVLLGKLSTLPDGAFFGCTELTDIKLPESIKSIGISAFEGCVKLESITLPQSLQSINQYVFAGCSRLKNVNLPAGLIDMGYGTQFKNCTALEKVVLLCTNIGSVMSYVGDAASVFPSEKVTFYVDSRNDNTEMLQAFGITDYETVEDGSTYSVVIQGNTTLGMKEEQQLTLVSTPESMFGKNFVTWTSSNESVLCVTGGYVKAIGEGSATVTATSVNGSSAQFTIRVFATTMDTEIQNAFGEEILAVCNIQKTLSDITLPVNWKFVAPDTALTSSAEVQYFDAIYTQDGVERNCQLPILVAEVTGAKIIGESSLAVGEVTQYRVVPEGVAVGKVPEYQVEWNNNSNASVTIEEPSENNTVCVEGVAVGTGQLSAVLSLTENITFEAELSLSVTQVEEDLRGYELTIDTGYADSKPVPDFTVDFEKYTLGCGIISEIEKTVAIIDVSNYGTNDCTIPATVTNTENGETYTVVELSKYLALSRGTDTIIRLVLPNTLEEIHDNAFSSWSMLENISIDGECTSFVIGEDGAVYNSDKTYLIWIPLLIDRAFMIPKSVTDFNALAFFKSSASLEGFEEGSQIIYKKKTQLADNGIYTPDGKKMIIAPYPKGKKIFEIPYGVEEIGSFAFQGMHYDKIIISETVYKLNEYSFSNTSDTYVKILGSEQAIEFVEGTCITEIPAHAFQGSSVTRIQIPASVRKIGAKAFYNATYMENFSIASNSKLEYVDYLAFARFLPNCYTFIVPETVRYVGCDAFGYSEEESEPIKTYYLGNDAPEFGPAIGDDSGYTINYVPEAAVETYEAALTAAGYNADRKQVVGCATENRYQPRLVTKGDLVYIAIPETQSATLIKVKDLDDYFVVIDEVIECEGVACRVTSIDPQAFSETRNVQAIQIPAFVTTLQSNTFMGCNALVRVMFGKESCLQEIESQAFLGCTSLRTLVLPDSVEAVAADAFYNGSTEFVVIANGENAETNGVASLNDVTVYYLGEDIFETDGLYWTISGENAVIFYADEVSNIPATVSNGTTNYTVTEIGAKSFGATRVERITIPATVKVIRDNAFAFSATNYVVLEEGSALATIEKGAFYNSDLYDFTVPASVTELGYQIFSGCADLQYVMFRGNVPTLTDSTKLLFANCTSLVRFMVPETYLNAYTTMLDGKCTGCTPEILAYGELIPITGITISNSTVALKVGERATVTVDVAPENTTDTQAVKWSSSDNAVAKVKNGEITAISIGTATITAKVGNFEKTVQVTVEEIDKSGISLAAPVLAAELNKDNQVHLTWNQVDGADGYALYRSRSADSGFVRMKVSLSSQKTGYTDENVTANTTYYYKLIPYKRYSDGTFVYGASSEIVTVEISSTSDPIPATGLTITPQILELYVGETAAISARLLPANTTDKYTIDYQSSATNILDYDQVRQCWVAKAAGTASVTAYAKDSANTIVFTASCQVKVKVKVDGDTEDLNMNVFLNEYTTLKEVPIPQSLQNFAIQNNLECSWKYPDTDLRKYLGNVLPAECQWKALNVEEQGLYEDVTVAIAVSRLNGFEIICTQNDSVVDALEFLIGQANNAKIDIKPMIEGNAAEEKIECYYNLINYSNIDLNIYMENGQLPYIVETTESTKTGTLELSVNVYAYAKESGNTLWNEDKSVTVQVKDSVQGIHTTILEGSLDNMVPGDTLKLQAEAFGYDSADVTFKSSNNKVLKLESSTANEATFKVQGYGVASIAVAAKADTKQTEELVIAVRQEAPFINETSVTLDKNKLGNARFNICSGRGGVASDVVISAITKGKDSYQNIFVVEKSADVYTIDWNDNLTAEDYNRLKKGAYKVTLAGKWNGMTEVAEIGTLTVNVTETKPALTVKQTAKVNLFYAELTENGALASLHENGCGFLSMTSKNAEIASVSYSGSDYRIDAEGNISLAESAVGKSAKELDSKITYSVHFKGYRESYTISKQIKVAAVNQKPKVKISYQDSVLYTALGMTSTQLELMNTTTKEKILPSDEVYISTTSTNYEVVCSNEAFLLQTVAGKEPKAENITFTVQKADWSMPITVKAKLKVSSQLPAAAVKAKTVTLNAFTNNSMNLWMFEQAEQALTIKNAESITVETVSVVPKNKTAAENQGAINVWYENGTLKAAILQEKVKTGTYQYTITPYILNGMELKPIIYTVKVVNKQPTVKVKAKGSIDLLQREHTEIVYTPTLSNITGKIVNVSIVGEDASLFNIVELDENGAVHVTATDDLFKVGTKYNVNLKYTIQNERGAVTLLTKAMQIKPKQSKVKANLLSKQLNCSLQAMYEGMVSMENSLTLQSPTYGAIEGLALENDLGVFDLTDVTVSQNGKKVQFALQVKDGALQKGLSVKLGKTYTLKLKVSMKGEGVGSKAQTVNLKVKITP